VLTSAFRQCISVEIRNELVYPIQ